MGTYSIKAEEFLDKFEEFLQSFEGEVHASCVKECWNTLCDKGGWPDKLQSEEE